MSSSPKSLFLPFQLNVEMKATLVLSKKHRLCNSCFCYQVQWQLVDARIVRDTVCSAGGRTNQVTGRYWLCFLTHTEHQFIWFKIILLLLLFQPQQRQPAAPIATANNSEPKTVPKISEVLSVVRRYLDDSPNGIPVGRSIIMISIEINRLNTFNLS